MATPQMNRAAREKYQAELAIFWAQVGSLVTFEIGEWVITPGGAGKILRMVNNVVSGLRFQLEMEDGRICWAKRLEVRKDEAPLEYDDEGYRCRSCDAILGDRPQPCPRCDGLPDGSLLSLEHEAELRHHDEVYGPVYGAQFNPIPFRFQDYVR